MLQTEAHRKIVIYDRKVFIVQATGNVVQSNEQSSKLQKSLHLFLQSFQPSLTIVVNP
jgi:hypothetical protein